MMGLNMTSRMRQGNRNKADRVAWICVGDGLPLRNCTLIDISESGAKVELEDTDDVSGIFSLWLSRQEHPHYTCRIV
jgi:hypothetical protein